MIKETEDWKVGSHNRANTAWSRGEDDRLRAAQHRILQVLGTDKMMKKMIFQSLKPCDDIQGIFKEKISKIDSDHHFLLECPTDLASWATFLCSFQGYPTRPWSDGHMAIYEGVSFESEKFLETTLLP